VNRFTHPADMELRIFKYSVAYTYYTIHTASNTITN